MARPYCESWKREIDDVAPSGLFFLGWVAELKLGAEDKVPLARLCFALGAWVTSRSDVPTYLAGVQRVDGLCNLSEVVVVGRGL